MHCNSLIKRRTAPAPEPTLHDTKEKISDEENINLKWTKNHQTLEAQRLLNLLNYVDILTTIWFSLLQECHLRRGERLNGGPGPQGFAVGTQSSGRRGKEIKRTPEPGDKKRKRWRAWTRLHPSTTSTILRKKFGRRSTLFFLRRSKWSIGVCK